MMGLALGLVIYFVCFVVLIYTVLLADVENNSFAYFLRVTLPKSMIEIERKILGERGMEKVQALHDYIVYERNPLLQVMYCAIVFGGWSVMFAYGYPLIPNKHIGGIHRINGYILFVACISSYIAVVRKSPGRITSRNIALYDHYEYDGVLFKNKVCPTVGIRKIARSKYDRMTEGHVPKFDHHCGWVNNTIGEENYGLFYIFLVIHMHMLWYGAFVTGLIFYSEVDKLNLHSAVFYNGHGEIIESTSTIAYQYLIQRHTALACLWLMKFVLAFVLTGFVSFHTYLICRGMTTNEYYKWKEARQLFKAKPRAQTDVSTHDEDKDGVLIDLPDDADVGCAGVYKNASLSEGLKPGKNEDKSSFHVSVFPIKYPYDFGIIENFKDVFWPRCFREEARQRQINYAKDKKNI